MIIFNIITTFFVLVGFGVTIVKTPCTLRTVFYYSVYLKVGDGEVIPVLLFFFRLYPTKLLSLVHWTVGEVGVRWQLKKEY